VPLSADDRIILLRIKIERAKQHISDLEIELGNTRGRYKEVRLLEKDPDFGNTFLAWKNLPIYSFESLAIAGDAIHNIRSSLDQLAYQLAVAGTDRTPRRTVCFPIAKDRDTYEAEKARKVKGIRPEAVELIDRLKPYKGGNDMLWRIHELDNIDKHRYVFTVGKNALFTARWWDSGHEFVLKPSGLKADAPLFARVFNTEVQDYVEFSGSESLIDPEVIEGDSLIPTLHQFIDFTEGLILSFKPFLG
jgi:hypothetical protein